MSTLFSDAEIVQFPVEPATPAAVKFTVYGRPVPQGSTRSFIPKGWTRAVITTDNKKLKPWLFPFLQRTGRFQSRWISTSSGPRARR